MNIINDIRLSGVTYDLGDYNTLSGDVVELSEKVDNVSGDVIALEAKIDTLSGNVYTKSETDDKIDEAVSGKADADDVYTKDEIDDKLSDVSGDTHIISGDVITISGDVISLSGDIQNISGDIITLSGDVSALETKIDTLSGNVYSKSETSSKTEINDALALKQNTLTAGSGITISGDVISISGTSLNVPISGGTGIGSIRYNDLTNNTASGTQANAFGYNTHANGNTSNAFGLNCTANGASSFVGGLGSTTDGDSSAAIGYHLETKNNGEVAFGRYNKSNKNTSRPEENTMLSVGVGYDGGSEGDVRINALEVKYDGTIIIDKNPTGLTREFVRLQDYLIDGTDYYKKNETSSKTEIDDALELKQNTLIAGDYITIDSANTISTSGLVTVEDNEVEEYPLITSDIYDPSDASFNVASYDDAADAFEFITPGPTFEYFDVGNSRFVFINESGETTANINGIYNFSTSGAVYPARIQEYVNLDLYEYHTTDRYNVHLKYSCKNGWRLKQFFLFLLTDYDAGVEFKTYQNYSALQSADAISENVYPALEKLTADKFDKNFTCNDPLLYESAYKRFRIKTSNERYDTISASTSATTNLARSYDVRKYVESKIGSGITSGDVVNIVSGYTYDKDTIDGKIDDKQDVLSAGTGISITNNVISTSGSVTEIENGWNDIFGHNLYIIQYGGNNPGPKNIAKSGEGIIINREDGEPSTYTGVIRCDFNTVQRKLTAGDNIDITNNVISTVTKFWCGTQAEYDAITIKDPNTVYMIHE